MKQPEHSSRRLYHVAWTIVAHCFMVCLPATSGKSSLSRMPPLGFSLELDEGTTSRQCCDSCTGFQCPATSRLQTGVFCLLVVPSYLADDIHLVSEGPQRRLRSSTDRSCAVPRTHNTFGDRSFAVAGPRVWNSLPANLRDEDITYTSFRRELKTYWFSCGRGAM